MRKEEGGRRKEEGGGRKEEGRGRRKEEGRGRTEEEEEEGKGEGGGRTREDGEGPPSRNTHVRWALPRSAQRTHWIHPNGPVLTPNVRWNLTPNVTGVAFGAQRPSIDSLQFPADANGRTQRPNIDSDQPNIDSLQFPADARTENLKA